MGSARIPGLYCRSHAVTDRAVDDTGRLGPESHALLAAICDDLLERDGAAHAGQWQNEILDHTVGLGVIDVEAIELSIADKIDACGFLRTDDGARGVDQRLLGRRRDEPVGHRIRADDGCEDARRSVSHRCGLSGLWFTFGRVTPVAKHGTK